MKLHLHLLDSPLDQFIKDFDVRELLSPSSSLAALNSCFGNETSRLHYQRHLHAERYWSGSPQICNGPFTLRVPKSIFVHWLRLLLGPLESGSLCLELAVELLYCLLRSRVDALDHNLIVLAAFSSALSCR